MRNPLSFCPPGQVTPRPNASDNTPSHHGGKLMNGKHCENWVWLQKKRDHFLSVGYPSKQIVFPCFVVVVMALFWWVFAWVAILERWSKCHWTDIEQIWSELADDDEYFLVLLLHHSIPLLCVLWICCLPSYV